jgi:purine-nucleoside phosphorylase
MQKNITVQDIDDIVAEIRSKVDIKPRIGMILGSGLSEFAESVENAVSIPFGDLPHWPVSTVKGHAGRLEIGQLEGQDVFVLQGRIHFYEGYTMSQVTLPVRVMQRLGVEIMIVTNAAGGIADEHRPGDVMLITDHINFPGLVGNSPLHGPNLDEFGPRFPDMTETYSKRLHQLARLEAKKLGIRLHEGVYAALTGPCYETPAEIKMLRSLGADAVGMSTVPEAIVANHMGMEILAISCITNAAAGISDQKLSHAEVTDVAAMVKDDFTRLVSIIVEHFDREAEEPVQEKTTETTTKGDKDKSLSQYIDHTLLKPDATVEQIEKLCKEAIDHGFKTVCLNSANIALAAKLLENKSPLPIAVVGFPLGAAMTSSKAFETKEAINAGAKEIDMVINIGALKAKDYRKVMTDIQAVVDAARPYPVKVIIETGSLTEDEKIVACSLSKAAGAAYVKTSTGFADGGATAEDFALMRRIVGDDVGVKASGGIKTKDDAKRMIEAGASRIGASASVDIVS